MRHLDISLFIKYIYIIFRANTSPQNNSHVLDLLDVNLSGTSSGAQEPTFDPWGMQVPPPPPQKAQVIFFSLVEYKKDL